MEIEFLSFIAGVLEVDAGEISLDTTYGECKQWDSMMSLTLIMEIEGKYGVIIPIEQAVKLTSLKAIYDYVNEHVER